MRNGGLIKEHMFYIIHPDDKAITGRICTIGIERCKGQADLRAGWSSRDRAGGTGFIGSNFIHTLLQMEQEVRIFNLMP